PREIMPWRVVTLSDCQNSSYRRQPEIVFIQRCPFDLCLSLDASVVVSGGFWHRQAWKLGKPVGYLCFEVAPSLPLRQPLQSVKDFSAGDGANHGAVSGLQRGNAGAHLRVPTHPQAVVGGFYEIDQGYFSSRSNAPSKRTGCFPSSMV